MDLVFEVHVVDARLHLEAAALDAEAASMSCEVWVFSAKSPGSGEEGIEGRPGRNAFIHGRSTERACGAPKYREDAVEAMLEANVQRVLCLVAVQREGLSAAIKEHGATGALGS
jgi:hypothetical protein